MASEDARRSTQRKLEKSFLGGFLFNKGSLFFVMLPFVNFCREKELEEQLNNFTKKLDFSKAT